MERHSSCRLRVGAHGGYRRRLVRAALPSRGVREAKKMKIEFSTDRDRLDVAMIHSFLANESYWVPGISRASVEKCIKNSLCFGVYSDGRQIGFARVVTDFVRYAHLLDVFVLPEVRGRGIGKLLMENILAHPELG